VTLLELVKKLARETGTVSPSQITTVESVTDDHVSDLIDWIVDANFEIEKMHEDWRFRMREGSIEVESGVTDYPLAQYLGDDQFKKVVPYLHPWHYSHIHVEGDPNTSRIPIYFLPYRQWAGYYDERLATTTEGRPKKYTVLPNEQIRVYPIPDKAYKLNFNYIRRPLKMEVKDACEPAMPADLQNVIFYWALRHYAFYDESVQRMQTVQFELDQSLMDLRNDQLPPIHINEPKFRGGYGGYGY